MPTIHVTLSRFSMRPNPAWTLDGGAARNVIASIRKLKAAPQPIEPDLKGYRGLRMVVTDDQGRVSAYHAFSGRLVDLATQVALEDPRSSLENSIFDTMPDMPLPIPRSALRRATNEKLVKGMPPGTAPIGGLECRLAPRYTGQRGRWATHQDNNNCYNYATDSLSTGLPAMPGGKGWSSIHDRARFLRAIRADGLVRLPGPPEACPLENGAHHISIMWKKAVREFHCVRLDSNGTWSHKDGAGPVRNFDDVERRMTDLRQAMFGDDPEFVGFFLAKNLKTS